MFESLSSRDFVVHDGVRIHAHIGGHGPGVLLHGHPQTHMMWHLVAPALARQYTVVVPDMRGSGDSSRPTPGEDSEAYGKRTMARDMVELMRDLGFTRFRLVGHDRGARVSHRLCVDHPDAVSQVALLDISPTRAMYLRTDLAFATAYYHWFFLIQPFDLPERLIGADPVYYLHRKLGGWGSSLDHFDPRALAEYERCFANPATIHATCEDYRASASIDLEHDASNDLNRIACPVLVLWGERGVVHRLFKPLHDWRAVANNVRGRALPAGHYLAEEVPDETLAELKAFF